LRLNGQQRFGKARSGELSLRGRGQSVAGRYAHRGWPARRLGEPLPRLLRRLEPRAPAACPRRRPACRRLL